MLQKQEAKDAIDYGYSFGSKKVGMAPGVVNLRFMCHCLARAVKMHLNFNPDNENFLQDLRRIDSNLEFTYNFQNELKVTLHP